VSNEKSAISCGATTAILINEMSKIPPITLPLPNPLFREIWKACPGYVVEKEKLYEVLIIYLRVPSPLLELRMHFDVE
jgi:hypothetical protein